LWVSLKISLDDGETFGPSKELGLSGRLFFAGGIVLMIELAGARWLAPAFGSGLEVWPLS
jgi:hypothetical protein